MLYLTIRDGGHHKQVVLTSFPASLGRSGACSLVLESDSVSGHHAVIEQIDEHTYILKDQNSTNGTYAVGRRISEHTLNHSETIHIADVEIQINFQEILEKTRISDFSGDSLRQARLRKVATHLFAILLGWVILVLTTAFQTYEVYWPPEQPLKIPAQATKTFLTAAVATLILGLIGKMTTKRFYYRRSLLFTCAIIGYAEVSSDLQSVTAMNIPNVFPRWSFLASTIILIPLVAGALYRPLQMWRKRIRFLAAISLVTLIIGANVFSDVVSRRSDNEGREVEINLAEPWSLTSPKPVRTHMLPYKLGTMAEQVENIKADALAQDQL